jgi:hypothetical protein
MSISRLLVASATSAVLFVTSHASAAVIDFDVASDLSSNFTTTGTVPTYTHDTAAGVGGVSGRLNSSSVTSTSTLIYSPGGTAQAINLSDGTLSLSAYFLAAHSATNSTARIAIGVLPNSTANELQSNVGLQLRLLRSNVQTYQMQIRNANNIGAPITLVDGNWYKISLDITREATTNQFTVISSLLNYGSSGVASPTTVLSNTQTTTFSDANIQAIWSDSSVYAATLMQNSSGGGAVAVDNYSISQVPEPVLGGSLAALLMIGMRRRVR